ncbi:MAG: polysaccharide pyruvyl transferase family protein [bacterium]
MVKIFAAGYFGYGNFGDELILKIFKKRIPPEFTVSYVRKMARRPVQTFLCVLRADCLVFPGGSVFQDETSLGSALFYCCLVLTALIFKKKFFLLDQGFEIKNPFLKYLLRGILKNASMISARDEASFRALKKLGLHPLRSADSVFQVQAGKRKVRFPPEKIGIIPRGAYEIWEKIIRQTKERWPRASYEIAVMSPADLVLARKISERNHIRQTEILRITGINEITETADLLVLAPYHSVVCAVTVGIPFIAVPYSAKIKNFLLENNFRENIFASEINDTIFKKARAAGNSCKIAEESSFQIFLNLLKPLGGCRKPKPLAR